MGVYMREERDECKFIIENKNELKKDIKILENAWDKIRTIKLSYI